MKRFLSSYCALWLTALVAVSAAAADSPPVVIEKIRLFAAGDRGYAAYRIPAITVTPQQTVLVAAEGRRDDRSDWGHIDLFYRRSRDDGRTWDAPRLLVSATDLPPDLGPNPAMGPEHLKSKELTISNATWITDAKTGRTLFLFCVEYLHCFIIESADGGETFSKPREITTAFESFKTRDHYAWRVMATGPGHGVQLASGRLVVPVWLSTSDGGNAHHPSVCATIYSDDGGASWQAGMIAAGRGDDVINPSETAIVECAPGKVLLNIRNESPRHRRAVVHGATGSDDWSRPEFAEELWEPVCMASIARLADDVLVFSNPATLEPLAARPKAVSRQRRNLSLRTSQDAGQSWSQPLVIEAGPSAYSDLAVATDGTVLCFYENGKKDPYEALTLARIPRASLPGIQP